ncbi:hypothetical protein E4U42_006783 [Claviceps africana]|uniref:Uncharacterized protein n=1 Tax=Claviceps africana TaxID=83212 RepID=A0A8K0NJ22_9HYPO|nr:hypothetical protein E4U42_006783 [Claviceps africana]
MALQKRIDDDDDENENEECFPGSKGYLQRLRQGIVPSARGPTFHNRNKASADAIVPRGEQYQRLSVPDDCGQYSRLHYRTLFVLEGRVAAADA